MTKKAKDKIKKTGEMTTDIFDDLKAQKFPSVSQTYGQSDFSVNVLPTSINVAKEDFKDLPLSVISTLMFGMCHTKTVRRALAVGSNLVCSLTLKEGSIRVHRPAQDRIKEKWRTAVEEEGITEQLNSLTKQMIRVRFNNSLMSELSEEASQMYRDFKEEEGLSKGDDVQGQSSSDSPTTAWSVYLSDDKSSKPRQPGGLDAPSVDVELATSFLKALRDVQGEIMSKSELVNGLTLLILTLIQTGFRDPEKVKKFLDEKLPVFAINMFGVHWLKNVEVSSDGV